MPEIWAAANPPVGCRLWGNGHSQLAPGWPFTGNRTLRQSRYPPAGRAPILPNANRGGNRPICWPPDGVNGPACPLARRQRVYGPCTPARAGLKATGCGFPPAAQDGHSRPSARMSPGIFPRCRPKGEVMDAIGPAVRDATTARRRAEQAEGRADRAEQRADEERARADEAQRRAERASARVQELTEELAKWAGVPPPAPPHTCWNTAWKSDPALGVNSVE